MCLLRLQYFLHLLQHLFLTFIILMVHHILIADLSFHSSLVDFPISDFYFIASFFCRLSPSPSSFLFIKAVFRLSSILLHHIFLSLLSLFRELHFATKAFQWAWQRDAPSHAPVPVFYHPYAWAGPSLPLPPAGICLIDFLQLSAQISAHINIPISLSFTSCFILVRHFSHSHIRAAPATLLDTLFNCSSLQIFNQPITWMQLAAFRRACWCKPSIKMEKKASKATLIIA